MYYLLIVRIASAIYNVIELNNLLFLQLIRKYLFYLSYIK